MRFLMRLGLIIYLDPKALKEALKRKVSTVFICDNFKTVRDRTSVTINH